MKEHKYLNNNNPRKKTVRKFRFIGTLTFHSNTDIATPSPPLFTRSNVLFHPLMLNLLFAYPIFLINTNVDRTTHPY